ncbi:unnamed protein product [Caenorhabditis angaria]|uniref:Uncharacterized protein n=1 Tax=Caenorhabditis angaria TaxID=860376 RepID=A0A9P1IH22_9PELO|nr:unnamed protein product [Caenorhabditis angaria]
MSQSVIEIAREAMLFEDVSPAPIIKKARRFNIINPFTWFNATQEEVEEQMISREMTEDEKLVAEIMGKFRMDDVAGMERILKNEVKKNGEVRMANDEHQGDEYHWIDEFSEVAALPNRKKSVRFDKSMEPPTPSRRPFTPIFTSTPNSSQKSMISGFSMGTSTILTENSSINSAMKKCAPRFNYEEMAQRSRNYYNICGDISEEEEEEEIEQSIKATFIKDSPNTSCSSDNYPNFNCSSTFVLSGISEESSAESAPIDDSSSIQNASEIFDDSYWTAYDDESLVTMRSSETSM